MRLCVINFSISNGGDFLIEQRMNNLIKRTWPEAEIDFIKGIGSKFDDSEKYDAVIGGGGPYYDDRIIKELFIPFFGDSINKIRFHLIGSGVYGEDCLDEAIYNKRFNNETLDFFHVIEMNNGTLCCRDELSWRVLKNNRIKNIYMTGCPAWYDFDFIDRITMNYSGIINKIVISDPGVTKKAEEQEIRAKQAIDVIKLLCRLFPSAEKIFTFNNGIDTKYSHVCNNIIKDYLNNENIIFYDMGGSDVKFEIYNDADLHVGFRVHSHIYSLSRRIPSILIEEDLRGWGMNEIFGLPHALSYDLSEWHNFGKYKPNEYLIKHLRDIIEYNITMNFSAYSGTFIRMRDMYYNGYKKWTSIAIKSEK